MHMTKDDTYEDYDQRDNRVKHSKQANQLLNQQNSRTGHKNTKRNAAGHMTLARHGMEL